MPEVPSGRNLGVGVVQPPEPVLGPAVGQEVKVEVALPADHDGDHGTVDGQGGEVLASQPENGVLSFIIPLASSISRSHLWCYNFYPSIVPPIQCFYWNVHAGYRQFRPLANSALPFNEAILNGSMDGQISGVLKMANNYINPARRDELFAFLEGTGLAFIGKFHFDYTEPDKSSVRDSYC